MNERRTYFDLQFEGVSEIQDIVRRWAEIIYYERRHENKKDGVDFHVDLDLNDIESSNLIVTKWGKDDLESCFHCFTGEALYELLPWWKRMEEFFESIGLHSWLPYPCILMSLANLRRHVDKGRPTALNFPIIGNDVTTNYIWYEFGSPDEDYDEVYSYDINRSILIDTTYEHGGFANPEVSPLELRAICNMGFKEPYEECLDKINQAYLDGTINKLKGITNG